MHKQTKITLIQLFTLSKNTLNLKKFIFTESVSECAFLILNIINKNKVYSK